MADGLISQAEINGLKKRISSVESLTVQMGNMVEGVNQSINSMNDSLGTIKSDLAKLAEDFQIMFNEQKRSAALQQAATELVRVRQELEQNFGEMPCQRNIKVPGCTYVFVRYGDVMVRKGPVEARETRFCNG